MPSASSIAGNGGDGFSYLRLALTCSRSRSCSACAVEIDLVTSEFEKTYYHLAGEVLVLMPTAPLPVEVGDGGGVGG